MYRRTPATRREQSFRPATPVNGPSRNSGRAGQFTVRPRVRTRRAPRAAIIQIVHQRLGRQDRVGRWRKNQRKECRMSDTEENIYDSDWYREQAAIAERQNAELVRKNVLPPKKHREISLDLADGTTMTFPNERALAEWIA